MIEKCVKIKIAVLETLVRKILKMQVDEYTKYKDIYWQMWLLTLLHDSGIIVMQNFMLVFVLSRNATNSTGS